MERSLFGLQKDVQNKQVVEMRLRSNHVEILGTHQSVSLDVNMLMFETNCGVTQQRFVT